MHSVILEMKARRGIGSSRPRCVFSECARLVHACIVRRKRQRKVELKEKSKEGDESGYERDQEMRWGKWRRAAEK